MLIISERFWKTVSLSVGFEYVENLSFVRMNVGPIAYGNGLMIGVYCFWIALDLHWALVCIILLFCIFR